MNTIPKRILVAACVGSLTAFALADEAHHPDQKPQAVPSAPAAKATPGNMDMSAMQANMKRMNEQMARIHATSDPAERERLMDEHIGTMQMMMQQMMEHEAAGLPPAK